MRLPDFTAGPAAAQDARPRPGALPHRICAFRILVELDAYESRLESYLAGERSPAARRDMGQRIARIRTICGPCGALTVSWLALMISHHELLAQLDASARGAAAQARLEETKRRHTLCVRFLSADCRGRLQESLQAEPRERPRWAARQQNRSRQ